MPRFARLVLPVLAVLLLLGPLAWSEETALEKADTLYAEKNYRDAAAAYEALLAGEPSVEAMRHASRRTILCYTRLTRFDDALDAAEAFIERTKATPWEARAHRVAGNLWLNVPHWGTRAGGEFHRGEWMQGMQVRSFRYDKERAVGHLEAARDLYASWDEDARTEALKAAVGDEVAKTWHDERIETVFDLAGACARFGIFENSWEFWWGFWAERDEFLAETAGEDDFDEYYGNWELRRKRPNGLRVGKGGQPIFPSKPSAYASDLDDDAKILFLLDEVRGLDATENKRPTALSYYRQAMLARSRFGMDRMNQIAGIWHSGGGLPLQEELKAYHPWDMADGEALTVAGGRARIVTLPPQWDVLGLLRIVVGDYAASGLAPQAQYATGLYHQTRQQYRAALADYDVLIEQWPKDNWAVRAGTQKERILAPQIHVNQTGVQLPGQPAKLQISYRNLSQAHFVAYRIDLEGFFRTIRDQPFEILKGPQDLWALGNWHGWFVHRWNQKSFAWRVARSHVKEEVARWSGPVEDDGTHRFSEAVVHSPLDRAGAYLVLGYVKEPPAVDPKKPGATLGLGNSRAVVVLTDLAFVQKPAKTGRLYFVADAQTGTPVPGAKLEITEYWSVYERKIRKNKHYRDQWTKLAGNDGLALDPRPKRQTGQLHVLVSAGEGDEKRFAWSGMEHWNWYSASQAQSGTFAYCITDRPVYRPEQTVRFKVWTRHKEAGLFQDTQSRSWNVSIYDPKGTEVYKTNGQTDAFGGLDGEWTLGEEPPLGVYRLQIHGTNWQGGQSFRVEEYKKPEFEVTVEPATTHAKLGQTLTAKVKAKYYFGAPVTDAEVKYKVFREEYRHTYYAPGRWDWLYGAGYGFAWYGHDWFPWWGEAICCYVPPGWWWGFYGSPSWYGTPVRELVQQGEGRVDADGALEVEIDTSAAARDHGDLDHRYVIQAEVRDASRRVITGEGAVKVTRQAFYAMLDTDRGWYRPGEEMVVRVHCMTPDGMPVVTEGVVTISEIQYGGTGNAKVEQTELQRFTVSTDERGLYEMRLRHERSGQLKFTFEAPDAWGGTVRGHGLAWVCGEDFDGTLHRFNDLELITDKRTYRPGETAHVMVNTKRAGSWVLFGNEVDSNTLLSWKMLHLDGRSMVVDVPVEKGDVPNFFVEAATVSNLRLHQQTKRICVPPVDGVIDVQVSTDQSEYEAGQTATIRVTAKNPDGSPAEAQVVLSAFDRSVLYIQPEYTPEIQKFFHGTLRHHQATMTTNLLEQFSSWGGVNRPFREIYPLPPTWWGIWGPTVGDWRQTGDEIMTLFGDAGGDGDVEEELVATESAAAQPCDPCAPALNGAVSGGLRGAAGRSAGKPGGEGGGGAGARDEASEAGGDGGGGEEFAEAQVRKSFADTALWQTTLTTDADGTASTEVEMPENLTTWKVNAWGMTKTTQVGQASTSCVTTKNLIVRLQAPRFFLEYDEVVLSANVHNYLETAKRARVGIELPSDLLQLLEATPATVDVDVPAGGEARVDWRVKVVHEGKAVITVKALTDEESDAVQMDFPVLVHGMMKQVASTGSMRPAETGKTWTVELEVPEKRRPELTQLEVRFAPSLVGVMLDALPYCLEYPYGCTEQTVSRFLPAVLTLKTLQSMGIRLEDVADIRGRMAEIRRAEKGEGRRLSWGYADNPVFDTAELQKIISKSLKRIGAMQQSDGGWGWWTRDTSSPYLTCYVLYALLEARDADVVVDAGMIQRGQQFLAGWEQAQLRNEHWGVSETRAFAAYVLARAGAQVVAEMPEGDDRPGALLERLWLGRDGLNLYGKSLLSLAFSHLKTTDRAKTVLQNVMQYLERNDETEVAWLRTPSSGWWYWWNSDIETNAWGLRALMALEPQSDVAPRMVKWLLNNRRGGYYWRSTRDTTLCVAAMGEFVLASGEGDPDYTVRFDLDDGAVVKEVKISKKNFFTYDNRFVVEGAALSGGTHTLKVTKTGPGALYLNTYLRYFTKEEHITAAGHELKIERSYFRLKQIDYEVDVEGADGQTVKEKRLRYERVPLKNGDAIESGDLVQVELRVKSDNDYTFLAFEDPKPAGCEAVQLRSGGEGQEGFWSYMELRDEKVVFFVGSLEQGEHLLRYRLRAEIPGTFHALPTKLFAMYVPELQANAEEMLIEITDR